MLKDNSSGLLAGMLDHLLCAARWGNGLTFWGVVVKNKSSARAIWLLNSTPGAVQFAGSSFAS